MEILHTIGRRKTSVARIYLSEGKGAISVNKKDDTDILQPQHYNTKSHNRFY